MQVADTSKLLVPKGKKLQYQDTRFKGWKDERKTSKILIKSDNKDEYILDLHCLQAKGLLKWCGSGNWNAQSVRLPRNLGRW